MNYRAETKSGKPYVIRKARRNDAAALLELVLSVFKTSDSTTLTNYEEFTLTVEEEEEFISDMNEKKDNCVLIIAEDGDGKLLGNLSFHGYSRKKAKHAGVFGMGILKEYQNQGIGRELLKVLLEWAKEHPIIERVELSVATNNPRGMHLYESVGFKQEGYKEKAMRLNNGEFVDVVLMYCFT